LSSNLEPTSGLSAGSDELGATIEALECAEASENPGSEKRLQDDTMMISAEQGRSWGASRILGRIWRRIVGRDMGQDVGRDLGHDVHTSSKENLRPRMHGRASTPVSFVPERKPGRKEESPRPAASGVFLEFFDEAIAAVLPSRIVEDAVELGIPEEHEQKHPTPRKSRPVTSYEPDRWMDGPIAGEGVRSKPRCLDSAGVDFPEPRPTIEVDRPLPPIGAEPCRAEPLGDRTGSGVTSVPRRRE